MLFKVMGVNAMMRKISNVLMPKTTVHVRRRFEGDKEIISNT